MRNMKIFAKFFIAVLLMVAFVSCDGHLPGGILVEKRHRNAYTSHVYCPTTHMMRPIYHPQTWVFVVQCDCGETHSCHVDEATFNRFNVGDSVKAKGYYHGKENRR